MTHKSLPFEHAHPHLKDFKRFIDELNKETERGAALISAAMIDDLLGRSILCFLIEHEDTRKLLEGFNAPLGTLSARALCAFSLGLISEIEYRECSVIRKIRNAFAHDVHVTFNDQRLQDLCSNLSMSAKNNGRAHLETRARFTTSAVSLVLGLTNRPHYASLRRIHYVSWKY